MSTRRTRALLLAATTLALVASPMAPAQADPSLTQVQARATALRHRLDALAVRQGLAVEQYDAADDALAQASTAEVLATTALTDARRVARSQGQAGTRRVRALYMSGGPLGLTATVLDSTSLTDALSRWQAVTSIVRGDVADGAALDADVSTATALAQQVARSRATTAARRVAADRAVATVQASLAEQSSLLPAPDADVVSAAEQQRHDEEAVALAQAVHSADRLGIPTTTGSRDAGGTSRTGGAVDTGAELPDVPAPSAAAGVAIAAARTRLGLPYVWGATGPDSFDCSGLTGWAYRQAGISLPRTASQQYIALPHVPLDQLAPGDLVFYATDVNNPATIHHVGMYVGAGLSLYAPQTGSVVKIGPVDYGRIIGAVRPATLR
ncbi:MAG: C40 family peptidase [Rhodoferax sp.]|nr:C40 family peptidase [Actinomycetota bacterium]